jgi:hypothetical protein
MKIFIKIVILLVLLTSFNCKGPVKSGDSYEQESDSIYDDQISKLTKINTQMLTARMNGTALYQSDMDSVIKDFIIKYNENPNAAIASVIAFDSIFKSETLVLKGIQRDSIAKVKENNLRRLSVLKRKFNYKEDKFNDVVFYSHKRWGSYWPKRKTLTSGVNSSGYAWLRSNYYNNDWLFHESFSIMIGDIRFDSSVVNSYDEDNITDVSGGGIYEVVTYPPYEAAEFLERISKNLDKKIVVRFNGRQYIDDITLSRGDKVALKECYELSQLLGGM